MISTEAKLKAMKAVKDFGKPKALPPPINPTAKIDPKKVVVGGKITKFKRTRTSKTGKKITEIVTRKSEGKSREYVKGVKAAKNAGDFPLSFQEYYTWLHGDLGWEGIDEKLELAGALDHAYSASDNWARNKTPQNAIAAFKTAKKLMAEHEKKLRQRGRAENKEVKSTLENLKAKVKNNAAKVKAVNKKVVPAPKGTSFGGKDKVKALKSALKTVKYFQDTRKSK